MNRANFLKTEAVALKTDADSLKPEAVALKTEAVRLKKNAVFQTVGGQESDEKSLLVLLHAT